MTYPSEWIAFLEPHNDPKYPCYVVMHVETAIRETKEIAKMSGHEYESDNIALEDFMIVHWAYFCEEPRPINNKEVT